MARHRDGEGTRENRRQLMLESSAVPAVRPADSDGKYRDTFDETNLVPLEDVDFSARPIDPDLVRRLAALQVSDEELCEVLRVDQDTLERLYGSAVANGRAQGRTALRRMQWRKAMQGNVPMLIHLGNQHLSQHDAPKKVMHEVSGTIGLEDQTDPREKLLQMMAQAATRLSNMPAHLLPQPVLKHEDEF